MSATSSYVTAGSMAQRLREIADILNNLGDTPLAETYMDVTIQVSSSSGTDPAARVETINRIAAVFGVTAVNRDLGGGTYHRGADAPNVRIFGAVPPAVEVQREQLLAQLAALDAQLAADRATQDDGAIDHGVPPQSALDAPEPPLCSCVNNQTDCTSCTGDEPPAEVTR